MIEFHASVKPVRSVTSSPGGVQLGTRLDGCGGPGLIPESGGKLPHSKRI